MGPVVAVGDVHGNREALDDLLGRLRAELDAGDTAVFLGDYIDRGPDSKGCVDSILRFSREGQFDVVTLMGNHEEWLLHTMHDYRRHSWLLGMEGLTTIASYSEEAAREVRAAAEEAGPLLVFARTPLPYNLFFQHVPPDHLDFFTRLRLYHDAGGAVFVHGGLDPGIADISAQPPKALIWGTETFLNAYSGPVKIVYGHWGNADLDQAGWPSPAIGAHTIGIDTISHGVLTAYRWPDGCVFQSARFPSRR